MSNKLNIIIVWYNEEKNLPKCFGSIKNFDDKLDLNVIYCDQSSTDNSVNIAKDFWTNIRNHPKYGMAEFSRMEVVEKEINDWDWLLFLDADEEVSKGLAKEIIKIINNNLCDICRILIDLYFMWVKLTTLKQPRLFKKWSMKLLHPLSNNQILSKNTLINIDYKNENDEIENLLEKMNRYTTKEVDEIGYISKFSLFYWLFLKPIIRFFGFWIWWWYFFKGVPWWISAYHNACYEFFRYAKYYEKFYVKKKWK